MDVQMAESVHSLDFPSHPLLAFAGSAIVAVQRAPTFWHEALSPGILGNPPALVTMPELTPGATDGAAMTARAEASRGRRVNATIVLEVGS